LASAASQPSPSEPTVSGGWTDFGLGMEYKHMPTQKDYDGALASCANAGPGGTLASPFTAEQADSLANFAPSSSFIGLKNVMVGQPKPCRDFVEFAWESGAVSAAFVARAWAPSGLTLFVDLGGDMRTGPRPCVPFLF
jgi:hypothetical protein